MDSGNLAGCLLTLQSGLAELKEHPVLPLGVFQGLQDTLQVLSDHVPSSPDPEFAKKIQTLQDTLHSLILTGQPQTLTVADGLLNEIASHWWRAGYVVTCGYRYRWPIVLLGTGIRPAIPRISR